MNFGPGTYGLGLLAGALSTLSPCVLPLVPVLLATAVNAHRWGSLALGAGLALSFAVIGTFFATLGASLGLDPDRFRIAGAVVITIFGLILLVPRLQELFARAFSRVSDSGGQLLTRVTLDGFTGQFLVGLMLGVVWSPCVGPTLGAAATLASQGKNLNQIGFLMLLFGVGAAAPLVLLGFLSRSSLMKVRSTLLNAGVIKPPSTRSSKRGVHMSTTHSIARAIAGLLSASLLGGCATQVAAAKHAAAVGRGAPERCFGVARGGRNDCKTDAHVCAGWAYRDADKQAFVYLPAGTCERIVGGLPDPAESPITVAP